MTLDLGDDRLHRRLDPIEHRLRVDPEEQAQPEQRDDRRELAEADVGKVRVLAARHTGEDPLEGPEQVDGREDDPDGSDDRVRLVPDERADQREELADETRESREPDRRERSDAEESSQERHRAPQPAELGDLPRVPAVVQHADQEEERAGREPVADHGEDAALEALGREGEDPQRGEPEVRDRRVGHESLQVGLNRRDDRSVHDADHREHEQ